MQDFVHQPYGPGPGRDACSSRAANGETVHSAAPVVGPNQACPRPTDRKNSGPVKASLGVMVGGSGLIKIYIYILNPKP